MQTDVVKARALGHFQMFAMLLARGRRNEGERIDEIVTETAHKKRFVIEEKAITPHLNLPHAESLHPTVNRGFPLTKRNFGVIKVWGLRGPWMERLERDTEDNLSRMGSRTELKPLRPFPGLLSIRSGNRDANHRVRQPSLLCSARKHGVNLRNLRIQITPYPGIVNASVGRGLQFHIAIQSTKPVSRAEQPFPAGQQVVDGSDHHRFFAGFYKVSDVVLIRSAVIIHPRHSLAVNPEPPLRTHSADFEPHSLSGPIRWNRDGLAVPAFALVIRT